MGSNATKLLTKILTQNSQFYQSEFKSSFLFSSALDLRSTSLVFLAFHSCYLLVDLFLPYFVTFLGPFLAVKWLITFVLYLPLRHFTLPFRPQPLIHATLKSKVSPHCINFSSELASEVPGLPPFSF